MSTFKMFTGGGANLFHYKYRTQLEGTFYRFEIHFNQRDDRWSMDLLDDEDTPIVRGLRLVLTDDAFEPYRHLAVPPGNVIVQDASGADNEAGALDLGGAVQLLYEESA